MIRRRKGGLGGLGHPAGILLEASKWHEFPVSPLVVLDFTARASSQHMISPTRVHCDSCKGIACNRLVWKARGSHHVAPAFVSDQSRRAERRIAAVAGGRTPRGGRRAEGRRGEGERALLKGASVPHSPARDASLLSTHHAAYASVFAGVFLLPGGREHAQSSPRSSASRHPLSSEGKMRLRDRSAHQGYPRIPGGSSVLLCPSVKGPISRNICAGNCTDCAPLRCCACDVQVQLLPTPPFWKLAAGSWLYTSQSGGWRAAAQPSRRRWRGHRPRAVFQVRRARGREGGRARGRESAA